MLIWSGVVCIGRGGGKEVDYCVCWSVGMWGEEKEGRGEGEGNERRGGRGKERGGKRRRGEDEDRTMKRGGRERENIEWRRREGVEDKEAGEVVKVSECRRMCECM